MKLRTKLLLLFTLLLSLAFAAISASAVLNDTVKVGLYYGSNLLTDANAEYDDTTAGRFAFGYFSVGRAFQKLGTIDGETFLTVSSDRNKVLSAARSSEDGYTVYSRTGSRTLTGELPSFSDTAVGVLNRGGELLLVFDYDGMYHFALKAEGSKSDLPETWFKGKKYYGAFEYQRRIGGAISVLNYLPLDDYLRCVVPYEMSDGWPREALKAQAVCARTYVSHANGRHSGFDVCASSDCQTYNGVPSAKHVNTDAAVRETSGECIYYEGEPIDAVYFACDGGATESAKNVWGSNVPYLTGKADPYEADISSLVKNYSYTVVYSADSLTARLKAKGYSIGMAASVSVQKTEVGNVRAVTVTDTAGKRITLEREKCRSVFGAQSQRFDFGQGTETGSQGLFVNGSTPVYDTEQLYLISGDGTVSRHSLSDGLSLMTNSGKQSISAPTGSALHTDSDFTLTGTGNGHNVGMSQWGAYAMAKRGYDHISILKFYYTGVTVE